MWCPTGRAKACVGTKMGRHMASRKDLLDRARDPLGFNVGITDPAYSSRDVPVNLTLQLTRREKLISNLRRNMPLLPDSPECVALRANVEGDRLNS